MYISILQEIKKDNKNELLKKLHTIIDKKLQNKLHIYLETYIKILIIIKNIHLKKHLY